ncbi:MAG: TrbC/VirB2 family protein [Clostridia bacterium]|nr:TrbC/VirB2 family protein [Clostridia bacterium]
MSKRIFKVIGIICILLTICINFTYAKTDINPDYYDPSGTINNNDYDELNTKVGSVLGYIQVIGTIISVAVLMILGIKYMAGSIEERATYKHTFIPYLIGAAIFFSGTFLPNFIYTIMKNIK